MAKRDLRSFKKAKGSGLSKDEITNVAKKAKLNVGEVSECDIQSIEETVSKYENKSESELMGDLERMIREGRENGTFTEDMLDAFIRNVSPMLDDSQRKKLEGIVRTIKINKI
jgi:hypothetical protein